MLIGKRGRLDDRDIEQFLAAGFSEALLFEAITIVAASTITNYTGNVTNPPLDEQRQQYAWQG
jgi:alkylhydroperoxidase family enzyme